MTAMPEIDGRSEETAGSSRRKLIKRLALLAATGYLAPKAVMISKPWACNNSSQPGPHGANVSGPFCP